MPSYYIRDDNYPDAIKNTILVLTEKHNISIREIDKIKKGCIILTPAEAIPNSTLLKV